MLNIVRRLLADFGAVSNNPSGRSRSSGRRRNLSRQGRVCRLERLDTRVPFTVDFGAAMEIGGADDDRIFDMELDQSGNKYVAGYFSGVVDFAPEATAAGDTLASRGLGDAYIAKYTADDSLVWVRRLGGDSASSRDYAEKIAVDSVGNVYVGSRFYGSADFGATTLTAAATSDGAVSKLSANGDFIWTRRVSNNAQAAYMGALALDGSGSLFVASWPTSTTTIVSKLSGNGSTTWTKSIISTTTAVPTDLQINNEGNIYVGGFFRGTVDFDPSSKTVNKTSYDNAGYVLSLNSTGAYKWVSTFQATNAGAGFAGVRSMALDSTGNILVGGLYDGSVDFNPGTGVYTLDTRGGSFAAKLSSAGSLVWAGGLTKLDGGSMNVSSVAADTAGNMYIAGVFTGTADLATGATVSSHTSAGNNDSYVVKLDSNGAFVWDEAFGGLGNDIVMSLKVDSFGTIHLAGNFEDIVDFNPDPNDERLLGTSGAKANGFVTRWRR